MKQTNDCTEPLQTKPTSSKKQTKGCPEPRADHQKPPPCTSANIDNVMVFFIEMKNSIKHNLKFSKGISHRSTRSIKNSLVPFFPDKINRET
jgi:hypothetical protein